MGASKKTAPGKTGNSTQAGRGFATKGKLSPEARAKLAEKARKQWADKNSKLRAAQRGTGQSKPLKPPKNAVAIIEAACGDCGASITTMCEALGIARTTFYAWRERHKEIEEAYKKGRAIEEDRLFSKLFEQAMAGNIVALIYLTKCRHNWNDRPGASDQKDDAVSLALKVRESLKAIRETDGC